MRFTIPTLTAAVLATGLASGVAEAASGRLGAGAVIPVRFDTAVSSATSDPEDRVEATVRENVRAGGRVVIPAGSTLRGHVIPAMFLELTYHLEHHLYPQVPTHRLAELARRLDPFFAEAGVRPRRTI